jgi:hypothetical protein
MADIKLQLVDLGVELDVPQDRQFPVAITFTSATLKDIESRSSDYTLEFRVPATKRNKSGLDHLDSSNVEDGNNILKRTPCVVKSDGMPIFRGDFKLMGIVDDRGYKEFKCIILGHAQDWAEGMKNKTLQSYDWGTSFTYNKANVEATWTNDYTDGYVFPLINYGAWKYANKVKAEEFRPAIFMRSLFEKAFTAEGYTLQTDTDADDFFHTANNPIMDTVVIPYTGETFKLEETVVNDNTFEASESTRILYKAEAKVVSVKDVYPKSVRFTSGTKQIREGLDSAGVEVNASSVRRVFLDSPLLLTLNENHYVVIHTCNSGTAINNLPNINTPEGKVFQIVDYGEVYESDPYGDNTGTEAGTKYFLDLLTFDENDNDIVLNINASQQVEKFKIQICSIVSGDDDPFTINFSSVTGTGSSEFSTTTNKYTAPTALRAKFRFDCKFFTSRGFINDKVVDINEGDYQFRVIHKRGSTESVRGFERIFGTQISNIDEYETLGYRFAVQKVGFESSLIDLQAGDEVYVDVVSRWVSATPVNRSLRTTIAGKGYEQKCFVTEATLSSIPQFDVIEGGVFDIPDMLDDRYSTLMYLKGCLHAFNLLVETDVASRTVKIKTRDDFYGDKADALDWTDKVDTKKQYVIDYLDYYKQFLDFTFKDDSADGHANAISDIEEKKLGSYRDDIGERFAEGIQKMQNPLFAYTYHIADLSVGDTALNRPVYLSRLWKEYSANSLAPPKSYNFQPRLLFYKFSAQHPNAYFNYDGDQKIGIPAALPCSFGSNTPSLTIDQHLGYNSTANASGLYKNFYEKTANTIEKGTKLTLPVVLTNTDILNFNISKIIYLSYPEEIKGYWIVDSVKNYLPTTTVSTTVELIKLEEFDARIETGESQLEEERPFLNEWKVEGESQSDSGAGRIGKGKYDAEFEEASQFSSDRVIVGDAERGSETQKQTTINTIGVGKAGGGIRSNSSKWSQGKVDEEAESDAREQQRIDSFENDKGKYGVENVQDLRKNKLPVYSGGNNVDASQVQSSRGNTSVRGGNTVMGRGNTAVGDNQTVVGQFSAPAPNASFAVGSGRNAQDKATAFSVDKSGIVREGRGGMVEQRDDGGYDQVWEEVNGEIVKVNL